MSNFSNLMQLFARLREGGDDLITRAMEGILETIRAQPELRFFVDGTVNGGHQGATVHLMRRIISLTGFTGRITVVYFDLIAGGALGRTPQKLALLLPGLDANRIESATLSYRSCRDIRLVNYDRRAQFAGQVRFGFTAGADDMNVNFARELKTDYFLRLQPYLWDDGPEKKAERFYESSRIETATQYFYPVDHYQPFRAIPFKHERAEYQAVHNEIWNWYSSRQDFDPDLKIRAANARAIYEAAQANEQLLLWPVYGLHKFRERQAQILSNLVQCASAVQRALGRPVVLVLLNDASEIEYVPGLHNARLILGYDAETGRYSDISGMLMDALADTRNQNVFLAGIGAVPGDVYNWLYANCGLPGVFEGQNTSSLVISLGRPFIQIRRDSENPYPAGIADEDMSEVAERAHDAAVQLRDSNGGERGLAKTIEFIIAARDPASQVHRYFHELGNYYQLEIHDKCFAGLVGLSLLF
jgi:hypothetical protein